MSHVNAAADVVAEENHIARRNAVILSMAQAVNGAAGPISIALGGLTGLYLLGVDKSLATAPATGYMIGVALSALPASILMRRVGRRLGFMAGALIGIVGFLICGWAILQSNFWLFVLGMALSGAGGAYVQQYRFAAADMGDKATKAKAISWVLAGGIGAAVIGPQLVIWTQDLLQPIKFAGAYFSGIGLLLLGMVILAFLKFDEAAPAEADAPVGTGRPLAEIMRQPRFIVSVLCAIGSFGLMSFVMTGAPLAMVACGISEQNATLGIQWHVMAMFAPSFFTGNLIVRFGKEKIVAAGLLILLVSAVVSLTGLEIWKFWLALVLLGVGWNFGFIGATAMLTDCYRPEEKNKAQGANDFLLFSSVAFASLMSGQVLNFWGWDVINWIVFPVIAICLVVLTILVLSERRQARLA